MNFVVGQRVMSQGEPELGLGLISATDKRTVTVAFPGQESIRTYGLKSAPLKRMIFSIGDEISSREGVSLIVEELIEDEGILIYVGQGKVIEETKISDDLNLTKPEEKFFSGLFESSQLYNIRVDTLRQKKNMAQCSVKGLMGGRMQLVPHQLFVASQISKRDFPRALLADEVGLGKTIEAGLILHNLIVSHKIHSALIIVPNSLMIQWFVEMRKKFSLGFNIVGEQTLEDELNPFDASSYIITGYEFLLNNEHIYDMVMEKDFDMVVVDEAHRVKWESVGDNRGPLLLEKLSKSSQGLLLLSATPESLGQESHFNRLKLLDPHKFQDFTKYSEESKKFYRWGQMAYKIQNETSLTNSEIKELTDFGIDPNSEKEHVLRSLSDHHGTGRVYFRNTRASVDTDNLYFPTRVYHPHRLDCSDARKMAKLSFSDQKYQSVSFKLKLDWLIVDFLNSLNGQKVLLICHSRKSILMIEKAFIRNTNAKITTFHSGLSLTERDRQAAYFADPEGAQFLLCTEIGSEGRNFEFAHNLVMFDVPTSISQLEQRIGRLDRIGQKNEVKIHLPYIDGGPEQCLIDFYHSVLGAFDKPCAGGEKLLELFDEQLANFSENPVSYLAEGAEFRNKACGEFKKIQSEIEGGRDILVELNSYHHQISSQIVKDITERENNTLLKEYMESVFEALGVESDPLDDSSYFIHPSDNMYVPHFPELPSVGTSITYNRQKALQREDLTFLSWDHPMVLGTIEFIESSLIGQVSASKWVDETRDDLYFELIFTLECLAPKKFGPDRYFAPEIMRVLIDHQGKDITRSLQKIKLDQLVGPANQSQTESLSNLPKDALNALLKMGKSIAEKKAKQIRSHFYKEVQKSIHLEKDRLEGLLKKGAAISEKEISFTKEKEKVLLSSIDSSIVKLDAIRVIF
ncbi:MAG: RNA polymerase-associated protein RapA [Bacteriovoracaceae bacterium]|nr:RNA polymerase-associated protein RapA [Bacteriovoracaceae bacterium]